MWRYLDRLTGNIFVTLIKLYQNTLSLDHSWLKFLRPYGQCRFRPTCSQYAIQAIEKYGCLKGGFLATKRILRCNPFHSSGYDPLQ